MYPWRDKHEEPDSSEEEELTSNYETNTEPKELIMIIAMAGSSKEETFLKETKKKLKTLMPYSSKREDLRKFLQ